MTSAIGVFAFVVGAILLGLVTSWVLYSYVNAKRTRWYSIVLVWIGWFFSFCIVLLIPLDIATGTHEKCVVDHNQEEGPCNGEPWIKLDKGTLEIIWKVIYWTTYILCWTAFPILQSYSCAGEFTFFEKFRSALRENIIFYLVAGVIGLIFLIWMLVNKTLGTDEVIPFAMAASNAWGLILMMLFLGYALVEIPRKFWRNADRDYSMRHTYFKIVGLRETYEKAKKELDLALKLVKKYDEKVKERDPYRKYVDTIVKKCPIEYKDILYGEGDAQLAYSAIVKLHARLMYAEHEALGARSLYEVALKKAIDLEDIVKAHKNPERTVRWTFRKQRTHRFAAHADYLEWIWKVHLEPIALRGVCAITGLLSLCVIWSELFLAYPKLSIFYQIVNSNLSFEVLWVLVFLPILYISGCAYWTLFRFRLLNFYRLVPNRQSDANSLLFNAIYLSRLTAPIAYNFLLMIESTSTTAFYNVMGEMKSAPMHLGTDFNKYFPIILVPFCLGTLFNVYSWFILTCCIKKFRKLVFDEDLSDTQISQGKEIVSHERELRERGLVLSIDAIDSATTPTRRGSFSRPLDEDDNNNNDDATSSLFPNFAKIFGRDTSKTGLLPERNTEVTKPSSKKTIRDPRSRAL